MKYVDYVEKAERKIFYKSNVDINKIDSDTSELLTLYCKDAIGIIVKWRKLLNYDEFDLGLWDSEIVNYIVNSYNSVGDENLKSKSSGGNSRVYSMSPESRLKANIPQNI